VSSSPKAKLTNIFRDDLVSIDDSFICVILISSNKKRPGSKCLERNNVVSLERENLSPVHRSRARGAMLYYALQMCDVAVVYFERERICAILLSRTKLNSDKYFYKCDYTVQSYCVLVMWRQETRISV